MNHQDNAKLNALALNINYHYRSEKENLISKINQCSKFPSVDKIKEGLCLVFKEYNKLPQIMMSNTPATFFAIDFIAAKINTDPANFIANLDRAIKDHSNSLEI